MPKPKTASELEARICELKLQGYKLDDISDQTGVPKPTVKDILRRNGLTKKSIRKDDTEKHAPTPVIEGDQDAIHPNPSQEQKDGINRNLTQENASNEIIQYIQFFRSRTRKIPYEKLTDRDKVWAEGNYGKRWAEGIHMMVATTGLSAESLQQAIDDYEIDVTDALERFNSKYRDSEGDE